MTPSAGQFTSSDVDPQQGTFTPLDIDGYLQTQSEKPVATSPQTVAPITDPMLASARAKYPFIGSDVVAIPKTGGGFGSEGWPAGETGDSNYPRPKQIPLNSPGIEYDPNGNIDDLAGEVLHTDKFANDMRDQLAKTFSPDQINYLSHEALDYGAGTDTPQDVKLRNGTDSFIRGALLNQWPAKSVTRMNLSDEQQTLIDNLKKYMLTGQKPKSAQQAPQPESQQ